MGLPTYVYVTKKFIPTFSYFLIIIDNSLDFHLYRTTNYCNTLITRISNLTPTNIIFEKQHNCLLVTMIQAIIFFTALQSKGANSSVYVICRLYEYSII